MCKVAIVTDSNSGINQSQAEGLGIHVLPMPFRIDDEEYFEDITLSQEEFYERLAREADISTSQPTVGDVMALWDQLLTEYDEIVHIPMSSGLSGSCQTAVTLADGYHGKVQVVNNQRISLTQRQSALDAFELAKLGKNAKEIRTILEREKMRSSIYITVDTLKYLKKGGRVTPTAAAIGTVLKIKPVLQIQGDKLDAYSKTRGMKQAKKIMIDALRKDFDGRFKEAFEQKKIHLGVAHTRNEEAAKELAAELAETFPGFGHIQIDPLSLSIACHIGPGALAVTSSLVVEELAQ